MTSALIRYAALITGVILITGWLLTLGFRGPGDAAVIRLSAIVTIVVQLVTFAMLKTMGPKQMIVAWGAGALLRLLTLMVYALLIAKVFAMPLAAALVSMAAFFFLSTLIEPLLLKP